MKIKPSLCLVAEEPHYATGASTRIYGMFCGINNVNAHCEATETHPRTEYETSTLPTLKQFNTVQYYTLVLTMNNTRMGEQCQFYVRWRWGFTDATTVIWQHISPTFPSSSLRRVGKSDGTIYRPRRRRLDAFHINISYFTNNHTTPFHRRPVRPLP